MKIALAADTAAYNFNVLPERRQDPRLTGTHGVVTLTLDDGNDLEGLVVNESFGGVGIVFNQPVPLRPDQEIELVYHGVNTWAVVRHVGTSSRGGCMVGLHWKSSQRAEQTNQVLRLLTREELQLPSYLRRFVELLPGGISLLWRLCENEQWTELAESIQRLGRDAAAAGVQGTEECLVALLQLIEDTPDQQKINQAIDKLVMHFIERTTGVAEGFQR